MFDFPQPRQMLWTIKEKSLIITLTLCVFVCFAQRMDTKLSALQGKINEGQSPMPLFTCLHVKPDVSELMFAGKKTVHIKWATNTSK